jgi:hypothetical protein
MHEKINFSGWSNCIRLYNSESEIIVATDIGLRILRFGFINSQNFFHLNPDDRGKTGGQDWRIYGGHRLWHAPEALPRSYSPDNDPVSFSFFADTLRILQPEEALTGIIKEMEITLSPYKNQATVCHRLINDNLWKIECSPWAISALSPGGRAIIPQEPYGEGNDFLLPSRPLVLWQYTKMADPRWIWGNKYIQAKQVSELMSEQKIGVLNKQGWTAYSLNGEILIKKFEYKPGAIYPDFNSNNEIYINGNFLEIETLGPLTKIPPHGSVEHTEHWTLAKGQVDESEESIDEVILPLVNSFSTEITKHECSFIFSRKIKPQRHEEN